MPEYDHGLPTLRASAIIAALLTTLHGCPCDITKKRV